MTDFEYSGMSPELREFLGIRRRPPFVYPHDEDGRILSAHPTPESRAEVDAWEAERGALRARLPPGEPQGYYRARKAWVCRDENATADPVRVFHAGEYKLEVTLHANGPWPYSKGRVFQGDRLITEICRNISSFPFLFVEGHPNGHDYLVAGEDYQGQTVVELDTGRRKEYLPELAAKGFGFCWAHYTASPSKKTLALSGCYWACPYEVRFVDFSDPMEHMPVLSRIDSADSVLSWHADKPDTCDIGAQYEYCTVVGKPTSEMTSEELAEADRQEEAGVSGVYEDRYHTQTWTRGSELEIAENSVAYLLKRWPNKNFPRDFLEDVLILISRCPDMQAQSRLRSCLQ